MTSLARGAEQALERLSCEQPQSAIIQAGADIAQALTRSRIAYLHFLNDDEDTIELGAWSRDTRGCCTAIYDRHYPVSSAGIWADSARLRRPCLHNDYAAVSLRRGLPPGHTPLIRHLGLPVVAEDKVRLLIGVGNKETDYDARDVALLERVARRIWSVVQQRRMVERLLDVEQRFRQLQELACVCAWEYDAGVDRLRFDHMFSGLFGAGPQAEPPQTLEQLLAQVAPPFRDRVRRAFVRAGARRQSLRLEWLRPDGRAVAAQMKMEFRRRGIGQGLIGLGILQDLTEQLAVQDLRRHADTDALTGLPNRRRLEALFAPGGPGGRRARDSLALHYIDLDDFKPVNDAHGHAMGDEVLRLLARRLSRLVRKDDLVARVGGDEFIVVQFTRADRADAAALADKIVASLCRPVAALGRSVNVGASIGIANGSGSADDLEALSRQADRALYRAKSAGGRCWRFDDEDAAPGGAAVPGR